MSDLSDFWSLAAEFYVLGLATDSGTRSEPIRRVANQQKPEPRKLTPREEKSRRLEADYLRRKWRG